ncbi:MAG: hypothetical protein PWP14_622 [Methanolobus sp.]|nr:hypothetical protein [Methanolobus sp.]
MKKLHRILLGFFLILVLSAGVLSLWWEGQKQNMYEGSFHSSYDYDVTFTTDSALSNVTLYIPLPVVNNTSSVGQYIIEHDFNNDDPSWEYSLVDTEHGLMLAMKTESLEPKFRPLPIPVSEDDVTTQEAEPVVSDEYSDGTPVLDSIHFAAMVPADHVIDTRNPLANEMVLLPKYKLNSSQDVYNYESRVYAEYESSPDARVEISVSLTGYNEWWILGWQWNSYNEWMNILLSGPQEGWLPVNGMLVTGEGLYKE